MISNDPDTRRLRIRLIAVGLAALAIWFLMKPRPETATEAPAPADIVPASAATPVGPAAATPVQGQPNGVQTAPTPITNGAVAIEDGKTIDFSSGTPVVRDSAEEKAIIDAKVKEMDEAAAGITFGPAP